VELVLYLVVGLVRLVGLVLELLLELRLELGLELRLVWVLGLVLVR
jgi:hypothetical protein